MNLAGDLHTQLDLAPTLAALPGEPRAVIERLASLGFRHVQLSATLPGMRPRELDGSARRDLLATLRRRELSVSGLDLWIPASHFADPAHVDRAVSSAAAAIELASDLERCPVSVTLPQDDDAGRAHDAVQSVLDVAHRHGIPIADHHVPVVNRDWDELTGIGIDPAAWLAAGHDPAQAVHEHGEHLITARLSDLLTTGLRGPIGTPDGRMDVTSYQVALSIAGHARPVVLDARQWSNPWTDVELAARHWRKSSP